MRFSCDTHPTLTVWGSNNKPLCRFSNGVYETDDPAAIQILLSIDGVSADGSVPAEPEPDTQPVPEVKTPCAAMKKNGEPCKGTALEGSEFCFAHQPKE